MLCTAFSRLGCNITIRSADIGVRQGATYRGQNIRQQTKRVGLIAFLYCSYTSGHEGILFYNIEKSQGSVVQHERIPDKFIFALFYDTRS
jgi:hypothetical protein